MSRNKFKNPPKTVSMGLGDRSFWESANDNEWSAIYYLNRLTELGISMFEWKNLPDDIDYRYLEYILYYNGQILFCKDPDMQKFIVAKTAMSGKMNFYRVPHDRMAYADNGFHRKYNEDNSVVIFNNMLRLPSYPAMTFYAKKLWEVDRVIDINIKAQKTPVLILADEDERLTMKNVYMQYDGNQPFIFGEKKGSINDNIQVLKTDAPYLADKLMQHKQAIFNEALSYLGIYNAIEKKERMISSEMSMAQGSIIASRQSRLEMRREAVDKINDMFGLNIEVNYRDLNNDIETLGEPDINDKGEQV